MARFWNDKVSPGQRPQRSTLASRKSIGTADADFNPHNGFHAYFSDFVEIKSRLKKSFLPDRQLDAKRFFAVPFPKAVLPVEQRTRMERPNPY